MTSSPLEQARDWESRFDQANAAAAEGGIPAIRQVNDSWMAERSGVLPSDVSVRSLEIAGVSVEEVTVGSTTGPVVIFSHGGGFVLGSAADSREWLARLARASSARVLTPNYRLAPEVAHPGQVSDMLAVYRQVREETKDRDLVLIGESAGGGLALLLLAELVKESIPLPDSVVLASPLADFELTGATLDDNQDPFVSRPLLETMTGALLQGQNAGEVSPLAGEFAGLPRTLIQVGTSEAVLDDSRRLAERLERAGVEVTLAEWQDMIHLWHGFPELPESDRAIAKIAEFITAPRA